MSGSARAIWYDGITSRRREVTLACDGEAVTVNGEEIDLRYPLGEARIDPGLGNIRRLLRFPDGATAETCDERFVEELQRRQGSGGFFKQVRHWEMSLKRTFAALLLTLLVCFAFVRYGVPFLSERAAYALPASTEKLLGGETLQLLDRLLLKPTKLPLERQKSLARLFSSVTAAHPERGGWRLELRSSEAVGANAFALPSGIVIVSDELVGIAQSDDEIAGVMAHEVGHVNRRHALRHLMQNSATALLVATLTGDITSISSFASTMPTALIDAKMSRDFEREADDAAIAYLKKRKIPVQVYAVMLARLDASHWKEREHGKGFGDFLSSHPEMLERVQRVMASAGPAGSAR